ncbi:MAG: hypothetical protein ABH829_03035 [archaeon]
MLIELNAKTGAIIVVLIAVAVSVAYFQFNFNTGEGILQLSQEFVSGIALGITLSLMLLILASPEGVEPIMRAVTSMSIVLAAMLALYVLMVYFF